MALKQVKFGHTINGCDASGTKRNINMNYMFKNCKQLESVDLQFIYPVGSVVTPINEMMEMFYGCSSLSSLDLSTYRPNPSSINATSLSGLFSECPKLSKVTLSSWFPAVTFPSSDAEWYSAVAGQNCATARIKPGRAHVHDLYAKNEADAVFPAGSLLCGSFGDCLWILDPFSGALIIDNTDLKEAAPVSSGTSPWIAYAPLIQSVSFSSVSFKMKNDGMFSNLNRLQSVSFSGCTTAINTTITCQSLFQDCICLTSVDLTGFPMDRVTNIANMFSNCSSLSILSFPDFGRPLSASARKNALANCESLKNLTYGAFFTVWDTSLPMEDKEGYVDWYDAGTGKWYSSAEEFPTYSQLSGVRYVFTKTGPMTDLSDAEILVIPDSTVTETDGAYSAVYSGTEILPHVNVLLDSQSLDAQLYTVSYENNLHVGEASITVSGNAKRHYTGSVLLDKAFVIKPFPITADMVSLPENEFVFTGGEIRPTVTVAFGGAVLQPAAEGVGTGDFCISWRNNVDVPVAGTADGRLPCAVLSALAGSNFTVEEEILLPFSIMPMPIGAADVTFGDMQELYGNGEAQLPSFTLLSVRPIPEDSSEAYRFRPWDEASKTGDYTVSGENNVHIGTEAYLTVTFTGNFSGSVRQRFSILAAPLNSIGAGIQAVPVYTGEAQKPELVLKTDIGGEPYTLQPDEDYEIISWAHNTDAWMPGYDEAKQPAVLFKGKGIFGGTKTVFFEIAPRSLKEAVVTLNNSGLTWDEATGALSVVYDGKAHIPMTDVTLSIPAEGEPGGAVSLPVPADAFTVVCIQKSGTEEETEDAVNAGTVFVKVAAKEHTNFTGTADARPEFRILPARLTAGMIRFAGAGEAEISPEEYAPVFTGGAILPKIRIHLGEKTIVPGFPDDPFFCSVSGGNNVNAHGRTGESAPSVFIEGQRNFTTSEEPGGVLSVPFAILPRPIEETGIGIGNIADRVYNGRAQRPAVELTGEFLCPDGEPYIFRKSDADSDGDNDYTVNYENCVNAAEADGVNPPAVVLSFHGNFSGKLTKAFSIRPLALTDGSVEISSSFPEETPVYTGRPCEPVPGLALTLGEEQLPFNAGTDYALSWVNNTNAWQAGYEGEQPAVVVTGTGNFSGTLCFPFTIAPRSIEDAEVRLVDDWLTTDPASGFASVAYNGKPRIPEPAVTLRIPTGDEQDGFTLIVPQEELKVTCLQNGEPASATEVGTYTVRVAAKDSGNFTGEAKAQPSFRIYLLSLAECEVRLAIPVPAFLETGLPKEPGVIAEKKGFGILRQGSDFTVSYANHVKAGTATATLKSITEPGVTKTLSFRIEAAGIRKASLPAGLLALESRALAGASFREIELPASCRRIGANAFAPDDAPEEQALLQITIPNAEAEVDEKAFGGFAAFTLRAPEGLMIGIGEESIPVSEFCRANGIYFEEIPETAP